MPSRAKLYGGPKAKAWVHNPTIERCAGRAWMKKRTLIMQRDGYLCQPCKRKGKLTPAAEVDHIKPRHMGGTSDYDNLEAICKGCHKVKTDQERNQLRT